MMTEGQTGSLSLGGDGAGTVDSGFAVTEDGERFAEVVGSYQQGDFTNEEIEADMVVPEDLPKMLLWRICVMPVAPRRMSKGLHGVRIELPTQTQNAEMHLQYVGKVVGIGPLAGQSERFKDTSGNLQWGIKLGDWVVYGRYAGQRVEFKGKRYLLMNDDEVLAVANGPEGFRVYA